MSFLFEIFTSPLGLPIDPLWEWAIMLVVGALAFSFAYKTAGVLGSTSSGRSVIHWISRFIYFVIMWAVLYAVIWLGKLIIKHWIIAIAVGVVVVGAILVISVLSKNKKKSAEKEV